MARDPEEIKREIEQVRAELSVTVEQLGQRATPKALAGQAGTGVKQFFGIGTQPRWDRIGAAGAVVVVLAWRRSRRKHRAYGR